jgi:molybdenum cofactor cytidylyltransferase
MRVMAVLLAAGAGSRFHDAGGVGRPRHDAVDGPTHKLLADLHGRPLWRHSLDHVLAAGLDEVVVITGAAPLDIADLHVHGLEGDDHDAGGRDVERDADAGGVAVTVIHNPRWASGQASSLQAAVAAATAADVEAIVVGLADQPFIGPSAWRAVALAPAECALVVATYDGRRGPNPVRIARSLWPQLPTEGDEGARGLLRRLEDQVCAVACVGSAADIDTLEDLERWTSS